MLALQLETEFEYELDTKLTFPSRLELQQMDCLITIILSILDGKCTMNSGSKNHIIEIYKAMEKNESDLFDAGIHTLIRRVFEEPDRLLQRYVHELRLYAESAIPDEVMQQFNQYLTTFMPFQYNT